MSIDNFDHPVDDMLNTTQIDSVLLTHLDLVELLNKLPDRFNDLPSRLKRVKVRSVLPFAKPVLKYCPEKRDLTCEIGGLRVFLLPFVGFPEVLSEDLGVASMFDGSATAVEFATSLAEVISPISSHELARLLCTSGLSSAFCFFALSMGSHIACTFHGVLKRPNTILGTVTR